MKNEPFFRRDGDLYVPQPVSRGPWSPTSLHARVVAGLLAAEIERAHGGPEFVPARFTIDLYRLPGFGAAEVTLRPIREGRRLKVIDAEYVCEGVSFARATCQLLRRSENPPGNVWKPPDWDAPKPDEIEVPDEARAAMGGMWATRQITGGFGTVGRKRVWISEVRELVGGEALTPFARVAMAADFASPFAHSGDAGLSWINTDITLYLCRLPVTEWVGFEVVNHQAADGVAIGECWLHDEAGAIGWASVAALPQAKAMA
jgi:hypothetical protein